MNRTTVALMLLAGAALSPATAPAQNDALKERMEELRRRREERRKEAERVGQGGAPAQAGAPAAKAGAPAQGGATAKPQGGAAGKAQGGAAGKAQGGAAGSAATGGSAGTPAKPLDELRATRADRRRATLERLRERWGPLLSDVRAREELRVHAERLAELQRIRSLAEEKKKLKVLEQVDAVITKEELRHANAMNALRSGATPKP